MGQLDGKVALVTGGSRGIGRAVSERLARSGALVAVHFGSDESAAKDVVATIEAAGGAAFAVQERLGVDGDADRLFARLDTEVLGRTGTTQIDILVNNAGIAAPSSLSGTTPAAFDELFAVNAKAPFFIAQAAVARMRPGGRIVNISTGLTKTADPDLTAYAMSKGAIEAMTLSIAKELAARGITVNTVAPGITDTDMNAGWLHASDQAWGQAAAMSAFNRVGSADDVADVVAFIVSDGARWVTGHYVDATGGSLL